MGKAKKLITHDPCPALAMVVGGHEPYVSNVVTVATTKADLEIHRAWLASNCTEAYHKIVDAVVLTKADYRRLLKAAKATPSK
jgi:hypothetical protein